MIRLFIFLILCTINISAQINLQLLSGEWTSAKVRMLDGSKVLDEPYLSSKFHQWKFSANKLCIRSQPVLDDRSCIDYKLQNQTILTSPQLGYEITKLTGDSLIIVEKMGGTATADKIKKRWFVRSLIMFNALKERTKNDQTLQLRISRQR